MVEKARYFINGVGIISPQKTFDPNIFLSEITEYEHNVLTCLSPDLKAYINPIQMRRLSRMLRIGLAAAIICLRDAKVSTPDGIITATGYGFLDETAKFLRELLDQGEKQLTPTYFMQGTSNALAGLVALTIKCTGYNNTYVSKGFACENALIDAIMQLNENASANYLVGSYDEAAEVQYRASLRLNQYKTEHINNLALFNNATKGTIQGEGSAFFMLSGKPSDSTWCELRDLQLLYKAEQDELKQELQNFLSKNRFREKDIDVVISGTSGDVEHNALTDSLTHMQFPNALQTRFKHLSGEYCTSISFALWLGAAILKKQSVPDAIKVHSEKGSAQLKNILIINHYMGKSFTFVLLTQS